MVIAHFRFITLFVNRDYFGSFEAIWKYAKFKRVINRGGVEDTRLEAKAKDTK